MQRMVMVLDCLENRKNYGAMAQKYAIAYHQIYRWVQRYLQDGWLGMNDRRGPADDPDPAGEGKIAPPVRPTRAGVAKCKGVPRLARHAAPRRVQLDVMIAKILFRSGAGCKKAFPLQRWPAPKGGPVAARRAGSFLPRAISPVCGSYDGSCPSVSGRACPTVQNLTEKPKPY